MRPREAAGLIISYSIYTMGIEMERQVSRDNDSPSKSSKVRRISMVISLLTVAVMVIAGWALTSQSNCQSQSPFLTYPLHVDKYIVQHISNDSYEFTVWVENQNYSSSNSGIIHCILNLDPYKGHAWFSSDRITIGPGERQMFMVWSPQNISSSIDWTSFDCGIVQ
jgi:hypothetical protein